MLHRKKRQQSGWRAARLSLAAYGAGLLLLLLLLPQAAEAQSASRAAAAPAPPSLEARIPLLEARIERLEERLNALLGPDEAQQFYSIPQGSSPVRGAVDAPITLVMVCDYQSNYCARANKVVKDLLQAYAGRLRFIYKHYPLSERHPEASRAALAGLAAESLGAFWAMHDLLFLHHHQLGPELYPQLAQAAGLDAEVFQAALRSLKALERLREDEQVLAKIDVRATPTVFLQGRRMSSWRYEHLSAELQRLLRKY